MCSTDKKGRRRRQTFNPNGLRVERVNLHAPLSKQTYIDLLQGGYKQMCDLSYLTEGEAGDGAISLMQSHSFTVTISGDVTFSQNHTAICEAYRQEKLLKQCQRQPKDRTDRPWNISWHLTNGHEVQILVYAKARHFCGFVARNCRKYPCTERSPTVFFVKVPDLYL